MTRQFLLLSNTRAVIKAENHLKTLDISCKVMPVPRALSSECGMCLEITTSLNKQQLTEISSIRSATLATLD